MTDTNIVLSSCIPSGFTPWESQSEYLAWMSNNINDCDVLVGVEPTASGKSLLNVATGSYLVQQNQSVALMAPRKFLQDQYTKDFGWIPCLKGMSNYICLDCTLDYGSCKNRKQLIGSLCKDCIYMHARAEAERAKMALFNFHSYFVNKMYKDVAIIDEGHGVVDLLYGLFGRKLWKCEVGYPDDQELTPSAIADVVGGVVATLELHLASLLKSKADPKMIDKMEDEIESIKMLEIALHECGNDFLILKKKEMYYGESSKHKHTEQEYIYVKTLKIDRLAERVLWPADRVKKLIFTSATIGPQDIELLGLSNRKVAYHESKSNIPVNNRIVIIDHVGSMAYRNREQTIPKIIKKILEIAETHKHQKGIVHCTYDVAVKLKQALSSNRRFMFHDNTNKDTVLSAYMADSTNKILIASGMAEGIDLKDDLARFQIITMLQFPSLADDVMKWIADNHPKRYRWMAIRNLVQQAGRIARHPKDYGITYFLDSELSKRFYAETIDLWPGFFKEAMIWM